MQIRRFDMFRINKSSAKCHLPHTYTPKMPFDYNIFVRQLTDNWGLFGMAS